MAIFHLSVKTVSRSTGRSATAAAAYRAGWMIADERSGEIHDYTRKAGVASLDLVLPADAPAWASDRAALWNAVEQRETRKNSTVAREFVIALPAELDAAGRRKLALDFAREIVDRHGCVADVAIHAPGREGDDRNHHAHILLSTRRLTPEGFTEKTRELDDLSTGEVTRWRERYAQLQNERLTAHGHTAQVDHRSLRAQGVDRVPTSHLGPAVSQMKREGRASTVLDRIQREHRVAANDRYRLQLVSSNLKAVEAEIVETNIAIDKLMIVASQERDAAFKAEQDRLQRLAAERPIVVEQEMPIERAPAMPAALVAAAKPVEPARPIAAPPIPGAPAKPPSPTVAVPGRPAVAGTRPITSGIPYFPINAAPRKLDLPAPAVTPVSQPDRSAKTITSAIPEWPTQAASQPSGVSVPTAPPRVPAQVSSAPVAAPRQPGIGAKPAIFTAPEFAPQPVPQKPKLPGSDMPVPSTPISAAVSVLQGMRVVRLSVPFVEKESAKAAGARWSKEERCWYVREGADLTRLTRWIMPAPPVPSTVLPDPVSAAVTTRDYRAELLAEVTRLTKGMAEIVERALVQVSGIVFAVNDRFAAIHTGRTSVVIVDREVTPIDLGNWRIRNGKAEPKELTASALSPVRTTFGKEVTQHVDQHIALERGQKPERTRSPGMGR